MRKVLGSVAGMRKKFRATVSRFGKKTNYHGYSDKTILLVEFEARVKAYKKGYVNKKLQIDERLIDFKLSHPTRISVISPV